MILALVDAGWKAVCNQQGPSYMPGSIEIKRVELHRRLFSSMDRPGTGEDGKLQCIERQRWHLHKIVCVATAGNSSTRFPALVLSLFSCIDGRRCCMPQRNRPKPLITQTLDPNHLNLYRKALHPCTAPFSGGAALSAALRRFRGKLALAALDKKPQPGSEPNFFHKGSVEYFGFRACADWLC